MRHYYDIVWVINQVRSVILMNVVVILTNDCW